MVTITESKIKFGKGMTNRQIAKLVGVTRQTVYNWKMGKTRPTQKHLMKLKKLISMLLIRILIMMGEFIYLLVKILIQKSSEM